MSIRHNIYVSIAVHAMAIISVVIAGHIARGAKLRAPEGYMMVSLFKDMAGIAVTDNQTKKAGKDNKSNISVQSSVSLPAFAADKIPAQSQMLGDKESVLSDNMKSGDDVFPISSVSAGEIKASYSSTADENLSVPTFSKREQGGLPGQGNTDTAYTLIRSAIEKAKTYPFIARKKRIEGTVITEFRINNRGLPEGINIRKSSGSEILDSAAISIIVKAAPFPTTGGHIVIPITFSLKD